MDQGPLPVTGWVVPRCFDGRTVCVMASGPSLKREAVSAVHAAGIPTMAINSTFRLYPQAWGLYGADREWWLHPENKDAMEFAGLKVSVSKVEGVNQMRETGMTGFDPDPGCIRLGGNSGYQAVHLMAHTGAARILLLGFDMSGPGHCHADHPLPLRTTPVSVYDRWIHRFGTLAIELDRVGIEVVNCNLDSALKCFRRASLESAIAAAKG